MSERRTPAADEKNPPRVIYLIALELVVGNAIFDNQVKRLLLRLSVAGRARITLVVLLPWLELTRRGVYSNFRHHARALESLRAELSAGGIELRLVRTLYPSAFFHMRAPGLAWFSLLAVPALVREILRARAGLVHCRYYYATFAALAASTLLPRGPRVIFDVRTLLPEQGIVNHTWGERSAAYRCWKRIEGWMLRRAGRVVSVSPAMTARLEREAPGVRVETIPNFVDLGRFRPDPQARAAVRGELGLMQERPVLVFSGTLGGRYPAERIAECAAAFCRALGPESFFLVLTSSDEKRLAPLAGALAAEGLARERDWRALGCPPEEVPRYLAAADYGLLALADFLTAETFLPLKFGEYLACGLPILTHPANSELTRLVAEHGVGLALDPEADLAATGARLTAEVASMRERCLQLAREQFDLERFAGRYARIYDELSGRASTAAGQESLR